MPQQADGWQEPELEAFRSDGEIAATLPWLNKPNLGDSDPSRLDLLPEHGRVSGRVHWLESVAAAPHPSDAWSGWMPGSEISKSGIFTAVGSETVASLIHDASNLITTIDLYCDLLAVPGVLAAPFRNYSGDLRLVASASRRLLEKLAAVELEIGSSAQPSKRSVSGLSTDSAGSSQGGLSHAAPYLADPYFFDSPTPAQWESANQAKPSGISLVGKRTEPSPISSADQLSTELELSFANPSVTLARGDRAQGLITHQPIQSLANELMANQRLLSALSGPGISLGLTIDGGDRALPLAADDLTRILVNLVKNASEAMPTGGHIQINLFESATQLDLTVTDNGPGIPASQQELIFDAGYSTQVAVHSSPVAWPIQHRGLGLAIVRSIVTAAGGAIRALNAADSQPPPPTDYSPSDPPKRSYRFNSSHCSATPNNPATSEISATGAIFCMSFPLPSIRNKAPHFNCQ